MPTPSSVDSRGKVQSTKYTLYHTRTDSTRMAGYLGLGDTEELRNLYLSQTWLTLFQSYEAERRAREYKSPGHLQNLYDNIRYNKDFKRLGTENAMIESPCDLAAHTVVKIIESATDLPGSPSFGPLPYENDVEAWNRAWFLLSHYSYLVNTHDRRIERLTGDRFKNANAKKPPFMLPCPAFEAPVYPPHTFMCKWINKAAIEKTHPNTDQFPSDDLELIDPRTHDSGQMRDYVRHALDCARLRRDIALFSVRVGDDSFSSFTEWCTIQKLLRDAKTKEEWDQYKFIVRLKEVETPADAGIFENFIV